MRFLLATCIFLTFLAHSQEQPNYLSANKISTVAYWNKGDKKLYTISESTIRYKPNSESIQSEKKQTETLEIKVVDSTEHSYTLEAKYGNLQSPGMSDDDLALAKELKVDYVIRYKTDEFGSFDTIVNLKELQTEVKNAFGRLKTVYAAKLGKEQADRFGIILDNMRVMYEDPEYLESVFLTDLIILHQYYGLELVTGEVNEYDMIYPLPVDITVTGTGTFTLSSISKATDLATITGSAKPNKEELNQAMDQLFSLFLENLDKKEKLNSTVTSSTKEKIQIRLSDGWIEKSEVTQTTTIVIDGEKTRVVKKKTISL